MGREREIDREGKKEREELLMIQLQIMPRIEKRRSKKDKMEMCLANLLSILLY